MADAVLGNEDANRDSFALSNLAGAVLGNAEAHKDSAALARDVDAFLGNHDALKDSVAISLVANAVLDNEYAHIDSVALSHVAGAVLGNEDSRGHSVALSHVSDAVPGNEEAHKDPAAPMHMADVVLGLEDAPDDPVALSQVAESVPGYVGARNGSVALLHGADAGLGSEDANKDSVALSQVLDAGLGSEGSQNGVAVFENHDAHEVLAARTHLVGAVLDDEVSHETPNASTNHAPKPSSSVAEGLRTFNITLQGDCIPKRQQHRFIQQLVDGASQAMISKGFDSVRLDIKVDGGRGTFPGGPSQLTFPDAVSAFGFYLLFNDYDWESTDFQCVVVRLTNEKFQSELTNPTLKSRFANTNAVTPGNVCEVLGI